MTPVTDDVYPPVWLSQIFQKNASQPWKLLRDEDKLKTEKYVEERFNKTVRMEKSEEVKK